MIFIQTGGMMTDAPKTTATALDCKNYFEIPKSSDFAAEWKELSIEDKIEIKSLVWAEIKGN